MRQTRRHNVVLALCRGLILGFCVNEEVCLLYMKGSFFWLSQDDMTMNVDIINNNNNNHNNNNKTSATA